MMLRNNSLFVFPWATLLAILCLCAVVSDCSAFVGHRLQPQTLGSRCTTRVSRTRIDAASETVASICVIGGGVSGLTAAWTAARESYQPQQIVVLEASPTIGGRVQSDYTTATGNTNTDKGSYILDRGFAVFIEDYPLARQLLDYTALDLQPFLPGALIALPSSSSSSSNAKNTVRLARVADPLRQPQDVWTALSSPVGTLRDKINVLPLMWHVTTHTVEQLFAEDETDTLTALKERWKFSDDFIEAFFQPFLQGIYLAPLHEQSSRMFSFVFKMFTQGAATLPRRGMGSVSHQLANQALAAGVDILCNHAVTKIMRCTKSGTYRVSCANGDTIVAETVIVATEGPGAKKLLSTVHGLEGLDEEAETTQRSVGCLYYSFVGEPPVRDPILILNGASDRGTEQHPVNNICFPSVVSPSYAPPGHGLCSVTILRSALECYSGRDADLDAAVRAQLATWFPDYETAILREWKLEGLYRIAHAQPEQLSGPLPANVHGGRPCTTYRYATLPEGLLVCGDHVATATLNGALESGVAAGRAAALKAS
jgi:phytoene dehydrogenase-like protein